MKRLLLSVLATLTLAWPAGATWSIVVVNRRTGEVAIGGATCLAATDLSRIIPAVAVGVGGGCAQATGNNASLVILYDELVQGSDPAAVLAAMDAADPHFNTRQIGIVNMADSPVTYTGRQVGRAKGGVVGEVGDLAYAIQGNVLTDRSVWLNAETALLATSGDLSQKLMAAMEAAAAQGGDGRCSCSLSDPTGCGAPPPSFDKSAHCGFMLVARMGDEDDRCTQGNDCANGSYYMFLNIKGLNARQNAPDPVLQLRQRYGEWRDRKLGKPDGILSSVTAVQSLPADGTTRRTVTVELKDVDGVPLSVGGNDVQVATAPEGVGTGLTAGPVTDNGDGTYSFELVAGTTPGVDRFVITAVAGAKIATLYPYLEVRSDPVQGLHSGYDEISAAEQACVPFVVNEPDHAGETYLLAASLGGTQPGWTIFGTNIPLNPPLQSVLTGMPAARLPNSLGVLDVDGRAEAAFVSGPTFLTHLIGRRVDWATLVIGPGGVTSTNAVGFDVVP